MTGNRTIIITPPEAAHGYRKAALNYAKDATWLFGYMTAWALFWSLDLVLKVADKKLDTWQVWLGLVGIGLAIWAAVYNRRKAKRYSDILLDLREGEQ